MLSHTVPFFTLYALLFADSGLSGADISVLFIVWSAVGLVANVPFGALADRFSRRNVLAAAGVVQAGGYALWTTIHAFPAFAAGFVLWGLAGALADGAFEALVYDGLATVGAERHYVRVQGWVTAAELGAQLTAALLATLLFAVGGFTLVGWASVGACVATGALALRLPETPRHTDGADDLGYFVTLRDGFVAAVARPALRTAIIVVSVLFGLDAIEEYFPLTAQGWGIPATIVPLAVMGIPVAGAVGAWLGGMAGRARPVTLALLLGAGFLALGAAGLVRQPAGLVGVAVFYGLYRGVLVVLAGRLQEWIEAARRATVTSVLGLGTDVAAIGCYAVWPYGQLPLMAALGLVITVA
ncbi:MAG TPA: MFS transporter, partial [Pseudonocardiaceae bacterium]